MVPRTHAALRAAGDENPLCPPLPLWRRGLDTASTVRLGRRLDHHRCCQQGLAQSMMSAARNSLSRARAPIGWASKNRHAAAHQTRSTSSKKRTRSFKMLPVLSAIRRCSMHRSPPYSSTTAHTTEYDTQCTCSSGPSPHPYRHVHRESPWYNTNAALIGKKRDPRTFRKPEFGRTPPPTSQTRTNFGAPGSG